VEDQTQEKQTIDLRIQEATDKLRGQGKHKESLWEDNSTLKNQKKMYTDPRAGQQVTRKQVDEPPTRPVSEVNMGHQKETRSENLSGGYEPGASGSEGR